MPTLRIGTRKSALAQAQANWTALTLRAAFPDLQVEMIWITTSGDKQSTGEKPENAGGLKALFTKEIEEALLDNRIDLAVHSMKDMAAELPKGLVIGAVPEREDPRDAWISKSGQSFAKTAAGLKIGTGAVRRQAQLRHLVPQREIIAMRGNVDTRLRKLRDGEFDALILANAGLRRLGLANQITELLPIDVMVPAIGQGCLGMQIRDRDAKVLPYLKAIDDPTSHSAAIAERALLKGLGGSCQTPIAGHATIQKGELALIGLVISPDGQQLISARENGRPFDAAGIGSRLAEKLLAAGADKIL